MGAISVALAIALAGRGLMARVQHRHLRAVRRRRARKLGHNGGHGIRMTPAFLAMMLGLTLFTTSVVAEIVRGSIQSLPRGQVEAAISLSLNPFQRLMLVILPQALRSMIPLLNNQYMNVWKNSAWLWWWLTRTYSTLSW